MQAPVGRVYVLSNPRMVGVVKIGFTLGTVEGRAKELDSTGLPEPFEIAYQIEVRGPDALERLAHGKLKHKRVRDSREFFEVDVVEAIHCVRGLATDPMGEECHPKYLELVDAAAKQLSQEREAHANAKAELERAEKLSRFEAFVGAHGEHQKKRGQLERELAELRIKIEAAPPLMHLTGLEKNGPGLLGFFVLVTVFMALAAYFSQAPQLAGGAAVLALVLLFPMQLIRSRAANKETHNRPILRLDVERRNLEYDLEKLDTQKQYLAPDLAEFAKSSPVQFNDKGFEAPAKRMGRAGA